MSTRKKPTLLHGVLSLSLTCAQNLPSRPSVIHGVFKKSTTDPYVVVTAGDVKLLRSRIVDDDRSPEWYEEFQVDVCFAEADLILKVLDKDVRTGETLGQVVISCRELCSEENIRGWRNLTDDQGNILSDSYIKFNMSYLPVEELPSGLAVPNNYYPARKLSNVTLYQDAHSVSASRGAHAPRNCFEDIYNGILTAKKFIYISGKVDPSIRLLRGQKRSFTLGKLLVRRAKAGVNVLILLWDEESKLQAIPVYGEDTYSAASAKEYFKGTGVRVCLADRTKAKLGFLKKQTAGTCYDHNQRFIVMDIPDTKSKKEKRCIAAYLGGLELCRGNWDTPDHTLYPDSGTEHSHDFYQPNYDTTKEIGPRLPQHAVHCRVEGRAAHDVVKTFEERWRKQAASKKSLLSKVNSSKYVLRGGTKRSNKWSLQVFRSINQDSAIFNNQDHLKLDGGSLLDDGIHRALVHQIRRSQKFVYIETAQFMGRCWKGTSAKNQHLIALELVSKICEKIFSDSRYAVYIVLPLHPVGNPTSSEIQEMLFWQAQTMDMMYRMISKALNKKGPEGARVTDYLNFYTLGSRVSEDFGPEEDDEEELPSVAKHCRGMINISGTLVVVDDEYMLMSSAAISQRGLSGKRNTEIAVGAWQPKHTQATLNGQPHLQGKVHLFRLSLWSEHTAMSSPTFRRPHRIGCVREMNKIANENWKQYVSEDDDAVTTSHLMKYPIAIQSSGQVVVRRDARTFPDTKARTIGRRRRYPSEKLTS